MSVMLNYASYTCKTTYTPTYTSFSPPPTSTPPPTHTKTPTHKHTHTQIFVVSSDRIRERGYHTLFKYVTSKPSFYGQLISAAPAALQVGAVYTV